jgi:hypothetical protein
MGPNLAGSQFAMSQEQGQLYGKVSNYFRNFYYQKFLK